MKTHQWMRNPGFTLIELVMVVLLLSILAAVAIPNFIDFRNDAKNAATQGSIGGIRSAISIARAAIQLREAPSSQTPKYPTWAEMTANAFSSSHPVLDGKNIMDPSAGMPRNPWSLSTMVKDFHNTIIDCLGAGINSKGNINSSTGFDYRGWCYRETSGEIWANSNLNKGSANKTENMY